MMNNDLQQFSEERLMDMQKHVTAGMTLGHADAVLIRQAIGIALAAKQARPVCFIGKQMLTDLAEENRSCGRVWLAERDEVDGNDRIPLYTTPQPAHTEQDGWKIVPNELTPEMRDAWDSAPNGKDDDVNMSNAYRAMLAAAPKPDVSLISEGNKNDSCQWNPDEDSVYFTGCGNEWQFTEGGIEDNKIKFCPYCSGKIAAPKPESEGWINGLWQ